MNQVVCLWMTYHRGSFFQSIVRAFPSDQKELVGPKLILNALDLALSQIFFCSIYIHTTTTAKDSTSVMTHHAVCTSKSPLQTARWQTFSSLVESIVNICATCSKSNAIWREHLQEGHFSQLVNNDGSQRFTIIISRRPLVWLDHEPRPIGLESYVNDRPERNPSTS